jgi:O-antigen/teichoic acid export membrane protein
MIKLFKKVFLIIGVDGAIFYTSLARIIQASTGIITLFFVAKFLTGVEQGFYYTFGSIIAIQVFFELGLNGIITQYVAHETSHLNWDTDFALSGSSLHLSRLSSLLHMGVKWYSIIAVILCVILLITGFIFFNRFDSSNGLVNWGIPWVLISFSTTLAFILNPMLAFIEGLGKVKEVARMRLLQQLITTLFVWSSLLLGLKLFASGIGTILGIIVLIVLIYVSKYKKLIISLWKCYSSDRINYKTEIFPYQWKIALSWVSGYFIFQLFNPVLFATDGAVVAGQMGMTLTALNGILGLSLSWMSTKVPLYSRLIAQKEYASLDRIFDKTLLQSAMINGVGLSVFLLFIFLMRTNNIPLGGRFLPYLPLMFMILPVFLNQFVTSWATYLRCHKQEPFLIPSIVGAITISLSTILLGKFYGVIGMTLGYCIVTIVIGFVWGGYIFKSKKLAWHT